MSRKFGILLLILTLAVSSQTVPTFASAAEETPAEPAYATGVYKVDGVYQYYEDGVFSKKSGVAICISNGKQVYVKNGIFTQKTGVAKRISDGTFVYVLNGFFRKATGLATRFYDGKIVYVKNGIFKKATGLAKHLTDKKWYYVKNGVFKKATGLGQRISDGKWFYVRKGIYTKTSGYTTAINNYKTIVYFKNGKKIKSKKLFTGMYRGRKYSRNQLVENFKTADWLTFLNSVGSAAKLEIKGGKISDAQRKQLEAAMEGYRKKTTSFGFVAINTETGLVISYNPDQIYSSASTIKAPYVAALCKYHAKGIAGRKNDIYQTLMFSSNAHYEALVKTYGLTPVINFGNEVGVRISFADVPYTSYSPRDLARLWCAMKAYISSNDENVDLFKKNLLRHTDSNHKLRDYYKKGWWRHSAALKGVYNCGGAGKDWIYAVMSNHPDTQGLPEATQDALITALSKAIR